jgi:hypothetical protein
MSLITVIAAVVITANAVVLAMAWRGEHGRRRSHD